MKTDANLVNTLLMQIKSPEATLEERQAIQLSLYAENVGFIKACTYKWLKILNIEQSDALQEGFLALLDAVELWSPSVEVSFMTIWSKCISKHMTALCVHGSVEYSYPFIGWRNKYKKMCEMWLNKYNCTPSTKEAAMFLNTTEETVELIKSSFNGVKSLDEPLTDDTDEFTLGDTIAGGEDPEEVALKSIGKEELAGAIEEALALLPEEERVVFKLYHFENRTLKSIANELGVACSTVKSRVRTASKRLRRDETLKGYAAIEGLAYRGSLGRFLNTGCSIVEEATLKLLGEKLNDN